MGEDHYQQVAPHHSINTFVSEDSVITPMGASATLVMAEPSQGYFVKHVNIS